MAWINMKHALHASLLLALLLAGLGGCAGGDGPVRVTLWHVKDSSERLFLEEAVARYNAQNPEVHVEVLYKEPEEMRYAELGQMVVDAQATYTREVRAGEFPSAAHSFGPRSKAQLSEEPALVNSGVEASPPVYGPAKD